MCSLIIIGGAVAEYDTQGNFVTKTPFAAYLNELAAIFDHVIWFTSIHTGAPLTAGTLDNRRIQVRLWTRSNFMTILRCWWGILYSLNRDSYFLFYYPAAVLFVPLFPLIRVLGLPLSVYLACDYVSSVQQYRRNGRYLHSYLYAAAHKLGIWLSCFVIARGHRLASLASQYNPCVHITVPIGHMPALSLSPTAHNNRDVVDINGAKSSVATLYIFYIGKMLRSKGVDILLAAFRRVISKHSLVNIRLRLVGAGADLGFLQRLAEQLDLLNLVEFLGYIDSACEIDRVYREASIVVVPSTFYYPEGVPRVIDEALARSIPVIASRVGGIPDEFADDEVLFVDSGRPDQLADAIEKLLFDEVARQRLVIGAQRRRCLWIQYGSPARQHASILLGKMN